MLEWNPRVWIVHRNIFQISEKAKKNAVFLISCVMHFFKRGVLYLATIEV